MPTVTPKYRKDPQEERFLEEFNEYLQQLEIKYISNLQELQLPVVFILGSPRSGTTLLTQLLAVSGFFCYVDNFVARFWRAPYVGMYLERLLKLKEAYKSTGHTFSSDYGRTYGILDPHEFSYFWNYWLKPQEQTHVMPIDKLQQLDIDSLKKEVNAMMHIELKPIFFKNKILFVNPALLYHIFPNSYFVIIKRDILSNAVSILRARRQYYGDENCWFSTKPSRYLELKKLSVEEQIVGQIVNIYSDIKEQIQHFKNRVLIISYEELCASPVEKILEICNAINIERVDYQSLKASIPERFEIKKITRSSEDAKRFIKVLEKFEDIPL